MIAGLGARILARLTGFGLPSFGGALRFLSSPVGVLVMIVGAYLAGVVTEKWEQRGERAALIARSQREAAAMDRRIEQAAEKVAAERTKARDAMIAELKGRLEKYAKAADTCVADDRDVDHFGGLRGPRLLPSWQAKPPRR